MSGVLRKSKEPSFDEYIFCCGCGDYVYEYCSIHGPLLVVPDDKVGTPSGFPPFVPRAALTLPRALLHLAPSTVPGAGIGVFSSVTLPRGVRFGPYRGVKRHHADSAYCWQIYDRQRARSHVVDAGDAARANWLRYVSCARAAPNLAAFQYRGQAYYRTVCVIPPFTELLVFCGSSCARAHGKEPRNNASTCLLTGPKAAIEDREPINDLEKSINSTPDQPRDDPDHDYDKKEEKEQDKLDGSNIQITSNDSKEVTAKDECAKVSVNVTQNESYTCDVCKKEFHEKALLISHIAVHNILKHSITKTDSLRWICASCSAKFATKSDLLNHEIKDHGSKIKYYACTFCNYKTIANYRLQRHIKTHSKAPNVSNICDTKLSSSDSLKKHVKNHTKDNPYRCKTCNAGFGTKSSLKRHVRVHTGEKPYACDICHLKFTRSYGLNRHKKIHNGPYQCEFCNLTFSKNGLLTRHMKIHGIKSYICTVCNSEFSNRSSLLRHAMIHTGIKPYSCTICTSTFSVRSSMKRHLRTHTDKNCEAELTVTPNVT